jgi:hypothetical protein
MDCKLKNIPQVNIRFDKLIAEMSFDNPQAFKRFSPALVKGMQLIKTKTVSELKRKVRVRGYSGNSIKYGNLEKGIRTGKNDGLKSVFVHIMGDFRLKFFEMGKEERQIKKGKRRGQWRGKIKAVHFFKTIKESQRIREHTKVLIRQELEKLVKKYLK